VLNVSADHMKITALLLRDSNPIHLDVDAVRQAGLGDRLVNQGGATMAYVINELAAWGGSRASIQRISCSFRGNVLAGDDVQVGGVVTNVTVESDRRVVTCEVWADVVGGARAISGSADVAVPL
jgi:acyl dehydratase